MKREQLEQIAIDILTLSMEHIGEEEEIKEEVKTLTDKELCCFINN